MRDDETLPPRQPNTFRTWLPRIWNAATAQIAAYPDRALIVFLIVMAAAIIFQMPGSLIAYGLLALALMGGIGYGVHKIKSWGYDEAKAECVAAAVEQRKREQDLSAFAAKALADERAKSKVVIQKRTVYVDRNIEKLVDSGRCLTDPGVSCINAAINGAGTAGQCADGIVPSTKPAG